MKIELRTITPEDARKLLEKNIGNRPVNKKHVAYLVKQLKDGKWKVNGDTICWNNNRLIDGQKRLMAVVESGVSIQTFVVDGVADDVFDTKDVGQKRSHSDTLACEGYFNTKELAACLGFIERYFTGQVKQRRQFSNSDILEFAHKYPEASDSLRICNNKKKIISKSLLAACHYLFSKKDKDQADSFVSSLISGQGLTEAMPLYLLRERLMRNALSKSKLSTEYIMALVIKAWNHERSGKPLKCLRFREEGEKIEDFPIVQ